MELNAFTFECFSFRKPVSLINFVINLSNLIDLLQSEKVCIFIPPIVSLFHQRKIRQCEKFSKCQLALRFVFQMLLDELTQALAGCTVSGRNSG